jgi:hypothetical protein
MSGSGAFNALAANNLNVTGILQAAQIRTTQPMEVSTVSVAGVAIDPKAVQYDKNIALATVEALAKNVFARPVGSTTELLSEFTDCNNYSNISAEYYRALDGFGGPNNFAHCVQKPLLTIGESFGSYSPTGAPDGMGAYLSDSNTVRVLYNCEGLAFGTNPTVLANGTKLSSTRVHAIDYDRAKMANFMTNSTAASDMVKDAKNFRNGTTFFNVKGQALQPRVASGVQPAPHYGNTDKDGVSILREGNTVQWTGRWGSLADSFSNVFGGCDWHLGYGCSADLVKAEQWGTGLGVANDMYISTEEFLGPSDASLQYIDALKANLFTGCGLYTTDLATGNTFTIGSMGGSAWEKITEFNTGNTNYVAFSVSTYQDVFSSVTGRPLVAKRNELGIIPPGESNPKTNYTNQLYNSPHQIYIGLKNYKEDGTPLSGPEIAAAASETYLARNGLAYGKCYGFALPDTASTLYPDIQVPGSNVYFRGFENHFSNVARRNADVIQGKFMPTSWQWDGTVDLVVKTQMFEWQDRPVATFPGDALGSSSITASTDYRFLNQNGSTAVEHHSADPRGGQRVCTESTHTPFGYILMYDMTGLTATLNAAGAGKLPNSFDCNVRTVVTYSNVANYTIYTGGGAKNKLGNYSYFSGTVTNEQLKIPYKVDTFQWYATSEGDWLYFGEDGSSTQGESCWLAKVPSTPSTAKVPTYFMSQTSGGSATTKALQTVPPRCSYLVSNTNPYYSRDDTNEYSGSWDLSGLLAKNADGSFKAATPSAKIRPIDATVSINDKLIMLGVQHHHASGGAVGTKRLGEGGQLIMMKPKNLPTA